MFYRTSLGRAFRATADNPQIAQLMGIDHRNIYAVAVGISLAVSAVAAVTFGIRANFDPSIGPARLLYAFEAVIIGGLGSLWGTLAGGIVLGLAQTIGARIDPEWQILCRASGIPDRADLSSARSFPVEPAMTAEERERSAPNRLARASGRHAIRCGCRGSRPSVAVIVCWCCSQFPRSRRAICCRTLIFVFTMLALAQLWNVLAGWGGLISVGQQAFVGLGAYALFAGVTWLASIRCSRFPWRGVLPRWSPRCSVR